MREGEGKQLKYTFRKTPDVTEERQKLRSLRKQNVCGNRRKKNYYPKIFFSGITANKQGETTYTYIDIRKKIRTHNNKNDNMELKRRKR